MNGRPRTVLLAVAAAAALAAGLRAAVSAEPAGDFLRYDRAGTMVWKGEAAHLYDDAWKTWKDPSLEERRYRYAPGLAVALSPMGAMPPRTAWVLWSAACGALVAGGAGLAVALALRRLPEGGSPWIPAAAAVVPLAALFLENVKLGQMNCWAFGLSMAALFALDRGRDRAAGLLAAGAALAKHLPILLVLWFLWKRRWKAALWGFGGVLLLAYLVPTAVLGPAAHHDLLGQWKGQENNLVTEVDEAPGMRATGPAEHVEGQSLKALLYRHLTPTKFFHLRDASAENAARGVGARGIAVNGGRDWGGRNVFKIWLASIFVVLSLAVIATGPVEGEDPAGAARRYPLEAALVLGALLLVSPESRNPHFQMLAPALAALAAGLAGETARGGSWWGRAGLAGAGAALIAISTKGILGREGADHALAFGTIGFGGFLVFASLAWTLLRERRAAAPAGGGGP